MKIKFSDFTIPFCFFFLSCFLFACSSSKKIDKDYTYFQRGLDSLGTVQAKETVIKTNDVLSIRVGSRTVNQEQARIFNLGEGDSTNATYTVNPAGNIEMPVIGSVKAAGLTLVQLQTVLAEKLVNYVKDPLVKAKYAQFTVNVLGEVKSPGSKVFPADYVTIIDAISASGDLTDAGKRDNILVIREENGKRKYYKVDIRSGAVFQSPAYQLQPNDLVYVEASTTKLKTVNQDPNKGKQLQIGLQAVSVLFTLISLYRILRL